LSNLDRLHTGLTLIRQAKFTELVRFYASSGRAAGRSSDQAPAGSLTVKSFDAATGRIELTAGDAAALPALNAVLAGISSETAEFSEYDLAESALNSLSPGLDPGLDPVVRAIAAETLVESIRQLAAGPHFDLL